MAQDVNSALMDLLAILSEVTRRLTDLLRGGAPLPAVGRGVQTSSSPAPSSAPSGGSALDRIQQYEPGLAAQAEEEEDRPRKRGRLKISEEDLKRMYLDEGLTAKEIGEKFGVAAGTVAQRVMKLGLTKRGPSPMKGKERSK